MLVKKNKNKTSKIINKTSKFNHKFNKKYLYSHMIKKYNLRRVLKIHQNKLSIISFKKYKKQVFIMRINKINKFKIND